MIVAPIMLSVAYLTYFERKVIGAMQLRKGPNVVGPFGLLQPIADGIKLFLKETVIPTGANRVVFVLAPMITFILALVAWAVIPFDAGMVLADINVGILYSVRDLFVGCLWHLDGRLGVELEIRFFGRTALRRADGVIRSFDGLIIITVLLCAGSLNLSAIVERSARFGS